MGNIYIGKMGETKYKIAYFHQDGLITGSAISLKNMVIGLNQEIFEPHIIIPNDGPAKAIWESIGAIVHILPFTTFWTSPGPKFFSFGNLFQYKSLFANNKIREFIKQLQPVIIHINDKAAIQVGISLRKTGIPIIQHSRSAYHLTSSKLNKFISSKFIKYYSDQIICISEDEIQEFENFKNKTILYNTVNLNEAKQAKAKRLQTRLTLNIAPKDIVIGIAENLGINKGLLDFLEIMKKLEMVNEHIKFLIVGNVNNNDTLESIGVSLNSSEYLNDFINKNNLSSRVIITGFKTNPLDYIAAMDLLIVSKSHGVLGRQPIEAQATGTVVLAINGHSGNSKIIKNGVGGFLFNNLKDLIDKLSLIVLNKSEIMKISQQGEIYANEHFNPVLYNQTIYSIYCKFLNKTI